jgi:PAS domain S-box-containing protein
MLSDLIGRGDYLPHGSCLMWDSGLLWLHVTSDVLIGLAYFSIPVALLWFVVRRKDLAFPWMFGLFAAFILACGTTHLMGVWTLWNPDYVLEGAVKTATAAVSVLTAAMLWPILGQAMALPSPALLRDANAALAEENRVRREAEARARASERRYAGIFEHLAEGLFVIDARPDGSFVLDTINPANARATGLDPVASRGRTMEEILPPAAAAQVVRRYRECIDAGVPVEFEETVELPVGVRRWHTVLVPVRDETGRIATIIGTGRDVTDRRRMEAELVQASKLATFGTLTAGLAHEMNQPLNVIRLWAANARTLLAEPDPDRAGLERILAIVDGQTERMHRIIESMRLFSRPERDDAEVFDAGEAAEDAVRLVEHGYAMEGVEVAFEPASAPAPVRGHRIRLEQVVVNLLSNARDAAKAAGEGGRGEVRVLVRAAGDAVRIEVEDNGGGVPPEIADRIFDPFFTTKEPGSGTGLGLSISAGIVSAMGGRLSMGDVVDASGRRGARFVLEIPRASRE